MFFCFGMSGLLSNIISGAGFYTLFDLMCINTLEVAGLQQSTNNDDFDVLHDGHRSQFSPYVVETWLSFLLG